MIPSNNSNSPPPIPPRQFQQPSQHNQQQLFVGQQPNFMPPFGANGGMYNNYNCYQQGPSPSFTNPWPVVQPKQNFLIAAEESSRNAFQAVESVVSALVSVANMLNTAHSAVFNTFRAVAGVAQQFRSFKIYVFASVLGPILSWCRFLWRHLLSLLRVRPRNYANSEAIWTTTIQHQQGSGASLRLPSAPSTIASSLLFWVLALGGPLLIFKCVLRLAEKEAEASKWTTGQSEHYTAQALFDFNAANAGELSLSAFDVLRVAPKSAQPNVKDWLLASTFDGSKVGLVPINYIKLTGKCVDKQPTL